MDLTRRNFLRCAALTSAAVFMGACSPKAEPTPEPAAPKPAEKPAEQPKPAGDKIVLAQWYHEYGEAGCQEAVNRIAKEYSDSQDKVNIEVGWFPGDYVPKVNASLAAGDPPDLFEHHLDMDYVRNDYIVNIDDIVTQEVKDDFIPVALYNCTLKGKMYALPVVVDFQGLYYRKSFCEAAGIDPSPESWTWAKVLEAGEKLTEGRRKGLFLGNAGGDSCMRDYGVPCAGPHLLNPETLEIDFNAEATWQTFEMFREYQKKGTLLQGAPMDWWDPSSFNQGLAAIQWGGFWQMPGTEAGVGDDFTFSVFPPNEIGGSDARWYANLGGWYTSVTTATKDLEEALKYLKWQWIDNLDWQNEYSTAYGFHIPARLSASAANAKVQEGMAKVAVDMAAKYAAPSHKLWGGPVVTPWNDAVTEIFKNNADAKSEVEKAYELCAAELEKQKKFWDELPGS